MDFLMSVHTLLSYSRIFQHLTMLFLLEFCVGISFRLTLGLGWLGYLGKFPPVVPVKLLGGGGVEGGLLEVDKKWLKGVSS